MLPILASRDTEATQPRSRELALLSLLSLPGLFALAVAVGWLWLTPPEDPERWATSAADELTGPPQTAEERVLQPFPVRVSNKKLSHYRDADGVFHFVEEPSAAEPAALQASNTLELETRVSR